MRKDGDELMNEVWKPIPGLNGVYEASTLGNIRSISRLDRNGYRRKQKVLKQQKNNHGYHMVTIWDDGKKRTLSVHRLIAKTFLDNPMNLPVVHHKNAIRTDNRVENLEWTTYVENSTTGNVQEKRLLQQSINYLKKLKEQDIGKTINLTKGKCRCFIEGKITVLKALKVCGLLFGAALACILLARDLALPFALAEVLALIVVAIGFGVMRLVRK